jgi:hypothetical protein
MKLQNNNKFHLMGKIIIKIMLIMKLQNKDKFYLMEKIIRKIMLIKILQMNKNKLE